MADALELTEYLIKHCLGDLDDLPLDLANTVVNVYHEAIGRSLETTGGPGPDVPDNTVDSDGPEPLPDLEQQVQDLGLTRAGESNRILLMNRMINSYRDIKRTEPRRAAAFIAQIILDTMKYGIDNAPRKSEVKRWVERWKKRKTVREIPGLIDRVRVRTRV